MKTAREFLNLARAAMESIDRSGPRPERVTALCAGLFHAVEALINEADPQEESPSEQPPITDRATQAIADSREKAKSKEAAKRATPQPVEHAVQ